MFQNIINNNEPQTYSFFFSQTVRFAFSLHQLLPLEYILRMSLHPFHSLPFFFFNASRSPVTEQEVHECIPLEETDNNLYKAVILQFPNDPFILY